MNVAAQRLRIALGHAGGRLLLLLPA